MVLWAINECPQYHGKVQQGRVLHNLFCNIDNLMDDRLGILGAVGTIKIFNPGGRVPTGPQGGVEYQGQVAQGRSVQPHDC